MAKVTEGNFAELWRGLVASGCLRHLVPEAHGGLGRSIEAVCDIRERLAYENGAADALFAVQGLATQPLILSGTAEQKGALLPRVASGEAVFAFALTEPGAGSDLSALSTSARREGDVYVLDGHKRFVSNAGLATHFVVFAKVSEDKNSLAAFLVESGTPGFQVGKNLELLSSHCIADLTFQGCRVAASSLLGAEGDGKRLALASLDLFRPSVGAAAVGMSQRALDEALSHARTRHQFGGPIGDLPAVQALLADSAAELDAARLLVARAARSADTGGAQLTLHASMAKLFATEAAQRVIDRCLQIHGGDGVVRGHAIERLYREVRALRIYEGTSEIQRGIIARKLLASASEGGAAGGGGLLGTLGKGADGK
jgi:acyl-CoA dehydrogenase